MSEWPVRKLVELTSKIGSGATPRGGGSVYTQSGVAFIRSQNVLDHSMKTADIARLSETAAHDLRGVAVESRDVLINITGDSIARCSVVEDAVLPARVNQHVAILRTTAELWPEYLQRVLVNPSYKEFLIGISSGGTRKALTKSDLGNLDISLPPLSEQQAIAEVLGALDDKIAANTKLADAAEELAIALLSTPKPTVHLNEIVSYHKNSVDPEVLDYPVVSQFSLPAFDAGQLPEESSPLDIKSSKFLIERPSVLVSKLNPRFPRLWNVSQVPNTPALASTEFLVLEPLHTSTTVLWAILSQPGFSASLESKVAGTSGSHQRVKPIDLLDTLVLDPREVSADMQDRVTSIGLRASQTRLENANLAATRDALLPQLMSGKLRVKDAEALLYAAV